MPIANCIVAPHCPQGSGELLEHWSAESGLSSEHMTVNLMTSHHQCGQSYSVMAVLLLPSAWSASHISALQTGLSRALAIYFDVALPEVHVVTTIIDSGMVVEAGQEVTW